MLGPHYRFQITSLLSIVSRLTGIWLSVVAAPVAILWLAALAVGEERFAAYQACLSAWLGQLILLASLVCLNYHLLNGIRHLAWDTGRGFEMSQVRASGWAVIVGTVILTVLTWGVAS